MWRWHTTTPEDSKEPDAGSLHLCINSLWAQQLQRQTGIVAVKLVIQYRKRYYRQKHAFRTSWTTRGEVLNKTQHHLPSIHSSILGSDNHLQGFSTTQMCSVTQNSCRYGGFTWCAFQSAASLVPSLQRQWYLWSLCQTKMPAWISQILPGAWPSLRTNVWGDPRKPFTRKSHALTLRVAWIIRQHNGSWDQNTDEQYRQVLVTCFPRN